MNGLLLSPYVDFRAGRVGFFDTQHQVELFPYQASIEAAKRWLGDRYLLARPINAKRKTANA